MPPGCPESVGKASEVGSGWGWCVVAASFVIHMIVGGIAYSGAVWLMILQRYFDSSQYETAWLGAMLLAITTLGGEYYAVRRFLVGCNVAGVALFGKLGNQMSLVSNFLWKGISRMAAFDGEMSWYFSFSVKFVL